MMINNKPFYNWKKKIIFWTISLIKYSPFVKTVVLFKLVNQINHTKKKGVKKKKNVQNKFNDQKKKRRRKILYKEF